MPWRERAMSEGMFRSEFDPKLQKYLLGSSKLVNLHYSLGVIFVRICQFLDPLSGLTLS